MIPMNDVSCWSDTGAVWWWETGAHGGRFQFIGTQDGLALVPSGGWIQWPKGGA